MTATNMCSNFVGFRCGDPLRFFTRSHFALSNTTVVKTLIVELVASSIPHSKNRFLALPIRTYDCGCFKFINILRSPDSNGLTWIWLNLGNFFFLSTFFLSKESTQRDISLSYM